MSEIDPAALEIARKKIEDALIEFRDAGISVLGRGNGFCVRYRDGEPSGIIRLGTAEGLAIGIKAYLEALNGA